MVVPNVTTGTVLDSTASSRRGRYTAISLEPVEVDDDETTRTHQAPVVDRRLDRQAQAKPWYASLRSNTAAAVVIFVVTPLILVSIGAPWWCPSTAC